MRTNIKESGYIDDIKNLADKVNNYINAIIFGRNYQPKVRDILNKHGMKLFHRQL